MTASGGRKRLSPDQRAAVDPAASVWVAASAGTGKTKVLTDRVLRLLLEGTPPARLLCLTFTRAAAAEMATRVNRTLGDWATKDEAELAADLEGMTGGPTPPELLARARRLFAVALDAPGGLKIMTIHAFCQSLLARFPLEAEVPPGFEVMDERGASEMLEAAQESLMQEARAGGEFGAELDQVSATCAETGFGDLMAEVCGARATLQPLLQRHGGVEGLIDRTLAFLDLKKGDSVATVIAGAGAEGNFDREGLSAACRALEQGTKTDIGRGAIIAQWLAANEAARGAGFDTYRGQFLTKENAPRKHLLTQKAKQADPDAEAALAAERARILQLAARRNAVTVGRATAALLRLAAALLETYERRKNAAARLDFNDLVLKAHALLSKTAAAPWVLYKLDGGIDHILVDEAQDTSPEQWRVIAALADEFFAGGGAREVLRTVFVVGDEKQSIFSFQGADLEALGHMRAHFEKRVGDCGQVWSQIPLAVSYRSTEAVLGAVDAVFATPEAAEGVALGEAPIRHGAHRAGQAGIVELWPSAVPGPGHEHGSWEPPLTRVHGDSPRRRLAERITDTIATWLDHGEHLESRARPIQPGDIMVLVRRRDAFVEELTRALKNRSIAVAGADRMRLTDHLAVMDLMALGDFLLLPDDDLTFATVLKGPLVGMDEAQLFALAHDRAGSLWRTLAARRDADEAFRRAHDALASLRKRADLVPPYELYAEVLSAGSGRRMLLARLGPEAADPIEEFLAMALRHERLEAPSLQGFLHWLSVRDIQVKRDMEQRQDQVRVMTVHGAKGLQSPIVILPDTTKLPGGRSDQLLWQRNGDVTAVLWPGRKANEEARCQAARADRKARDAAEYRRLLYVAMTRAEDRLYVCGWHNTSHPQEGSWYQLIAEGIEAIAERFQFDPGPSRGDDPDSGWRGDALRIRGIQAKPPQADTTPPPTPAEVERLPEFARSDPVPEPVPSRPLAPSRPRLSEPAVFSPLSGGEGRARFQRGRLIHQLLQYLPAIAPEARRRAGARFLANPGHGLNAATREEISREVFAVLNDPGFTDLFAPGSRAEVPLIGVVGETVIAGQVDRLVVKENEVLIVDFKSNRPAPRNTSEVPAAYLRQMACYGAVLRRAFPDRDVRCALLWTDRPAADAPEPKPARGAQPGWPMLNSRAGAHI